MKYIYTFLFAFSVMLASGQTPYFQKLYGDVAMDDAISITTTMDSGYCLVGTSGGNSTDMANIIIYRTNRFGDLIWARTIGDFKDDFAADIKETSDGGFIVCGSTYGSPIDTADLDIFIVKTDDLGYVQWASTFGGSGFDETNCVLTTADGGFLLFGNTMSFGNVMRSALVVKVDANGFLQWSKLFNSTNINLFYKAKYTDDGNIIALGSCYHDASGAFDHYVVKMDDNANMIWAKRYGSAAADNLYDVAMADDGYVFAGESYNTGTPTFDQHVFKTDFSGNVLWSMNYGTTGNDRATGAVVDLAGNIAITGTTDIGGTGTTQMTLHKLTGGGTTLFSNSYGDPVSDSEGRAMIETPDGGYAICGFALNIPDPVGDAYFVKTDYNGESGCYQAPITFSMAANVITDSSGSDTLDVLLGEFNLSPFNDFFANQFSQLCFYSSIQNDHAASISVYPNPANDRVIIRQTMADPIRISISDISGRIVKTESANAIENIINVPDLANGSYLITIEGDGFRVVKKMLVARG